MFSANSVPKLSLVSSYNQEPQRAVSVEHNFNAPGVRYLSADDLSKQDCYLRFYRNLAYKGGSVPEQGNSLINDDDSTRHQPFAIVIKSDEQICLLPKIPGYLHHSSLAAGQAVLFACTAEINRGKFINISDHSGHYKPKLLNMIFGLNKFKERGANLVGTKVVINEWVNDFPDSNCVAKSMEFNDAVTFLTIYGEGFAQLHAQVASLADAKKVFSGNSSNIGSARSVSLIFYVADENELYQLEYKNNEIICNSYYQLYKAKACRSAKVLNITHGNQLLWSAVPQKSQEEEQLEYFVCLDASGAKVSAPPVTAPLQQPQSPRTPTNSLRQPQTLMKTPEKSEVDLDRLAHYHAKLH